MLRSGSRRGLHSAPNPLQWSVHALIPHKRAGDFRPDRAGFCFAVLLAVADRRVTFATTTAAEHAETRASWSAKEVVCSCGILACILTTYLYFAG